MLLDENNVAVYSQGFDCEVPEKNVLAVAAPVQPEARTYGIPGSIWAWMAASYAVFFAGLMLASGYDGKAFFVIVISIAYTAIYFGTAYILNIIRPAPHVPAPSQWVNGKFDTHTGMMSFGSVFGQMLVVPIVLALFGVGVAIIRLAVM